MGNQSSAESATDYSKGELGDAIGLANHAAGIAVSKAGAAVVSPEELEVSL